MTTIGTLVVLAAGVMLGSVALSAEFMAAAQPRLAQANPGRVCVQVISCGTKDGKRKEYPTPCAAQDDGATNITPKSGSNCDNSK